MKTTLARLTLFALAAGCSEEVVVEDAPETMGTAAALGVADEVLTSSSCTVPSAVSQDQLVEALTNGGIVILGRDARLTSTTTVTEERPGGILHVSVDVLGFSDVEIVGGGFVPSSILLPRRRSARLVDGAGVEHVPSTARVDEPADMQALRDGELASFAVLAARWGDSALVAQVFARTGRMVRSAPDIDVNIDEIASAAFAARGGL